MTAVSQKKVIRHLPPASGVAGRLARWRYGIARRIVQLSVLALFIGTARLGWTVAKAPLLSGDYSASLIAGVVPLSDPFAVLQKLCAGHTPELTMIIGALIVLALYIVLGGRSFCAWICPMNIVTDSAEKLRAALGIRSDFVRLDSRTRYAFAIASLIASAVSGVAAFEWISPQAFLWREAVWGIGLGFISALLGVFAFDLAVVRRGWCGHLCPLGAFWSTVGRVGVVKPLFDSTKCTRCGDCLKCCPEPQVLNFNRAGQKGFIASGECTNCGRCIAICPENALHFGVRFAAHPEKKQSSCGDSNE